MTSCGCQLWTPHLVLPAFHEYRRARAGCSHCGDVVFLHPPPPPSQEIRECDNNDEDAALLLLSQTETPAQCVCAALTSNLLSHTGSCPGQPPTQWLLPAHAAAAIFASSEEVAAKFLVIALYDAAASRGESGARPGDWHRAARCMRAPLVVVVHAREFAEFLAKDDASVAALGEGFVRAFLEGVSTAIAVHSPQAGAPPSAAAVKQLVWCSPLASDHFASDPIAALPGSGGTALYGPALLWVACVTTAKMLVAAKQGGDDSGTFAFTAASLPAPLPPVGLLKDDPALDAAARAALLEASQKHLSAAPAAAHFSAWLAALPPISLALLLGTRVTPGSTTACAAGVLPFPLHHLLASFSRPHQLGQPFSVGARALAKHHHRDESTNWWQQQAVLVMSGAAAPARGGGAQGVTKGSQQEKNLAALRVLTQSILQRAAWINVHMLPHSVVTMEVRNAAGYGARWAGSLITNQQQAPQQAPQDPPNPESADVQATPAAAASASSADDDEQRKAIDAQPVLLYVDRGERVLVELLRQQGSGGDASAVQSLDFRGFLEPHSEQGHEKGWVH